MECKVTPEYWKKMRKFGVSGLYRTVGRSRVFGLDTATRSHKGRTEKCVSLRGSVGRLSGGRHVRARGALHVTLRPCLRVEVFINRCFFDAVVDDMIPMAASHVTSCAYICSTAENDTTASQR